MITASARLVRIPAEMRGQGSRKDDAADLLVGRNPVGPCRLDQRRLDPAHAVDRVQQHREQAEERDEADLLEVADGVQQDDRDRQQRRRRHRAPVLDVRHREPARPEPRAERNADDDAEGGADPEAEQDSHDARHHIGVELLEEARVSGTRFASQLAAGSIGCLADPPTACQATTISTGHGDLSRPILSAETDR